MAQWEMCCAALVGWNGQGYPTPARDYKIVLCYYTPTGVITKFPYINTWGQVIAILGAAEWEAITMQHGLEIVSPHVGWSGGVRGIRMDHLDHPSGDKNWIYDACNMVAYFKRPIQTGRKIDDAL